MKIALLLSVCLLLSAAVPAAAKNQPEAELEPPKAQVFSPSCSKKGLQFGESVEDALNLGIHYCLFNLEITEFTDASKNQLKYKYKGDTYTFNLDAFERWGTLFSQIQAAGIDLSAEFLLPWDDSQTDLIYPTARSQNAFHNYYAWNISTREARKKYAALFSCIAEEFDGRHGLGYINNYIIGNEVNGYAQWHYTGSNSLEENAKLYADTFQLVNKAVKRKCADTRVSICLEHTWNTEISGQVHSGRAFLDAFAERLKKYKSPDFTISYHAYSEPLTQADFWNNSKYRVKDSVNTPYISMKNIEQLTKYVKSNYGFQTRIMLTEQGFSSHGADGEIKQAAAIAYAYYKAEFNDMVDSIIFRCQADNPVEMSRDGLYMGLWTAGMGKQKAAHAVFQYMDTSECEAYTKSCREYLGIQNWAELVPDYNIEYFDW